MDAQPKDYRVEMKVRNNRILSAMEEKGIDSIAELCRQMGRPSLQTQVSSLVAMTMTPKTKKDEWRSAVIRLSEFFACMPEDLFSDEQQQHVLETNRAHVELSYTELEQLTTRRSDPATPEQLTQATELREAIQRSLTSLTPREERVIRMRFGFGTDEKTLDEIAEEFDVSQERVRQIEAKALRKLKGPARKVILQRVACTEQPFPGRDARIHGTLVLDEDVLSVR